MTALVLYAFALDLLIGDPPWIRHPVVIIGWAISRLEIWLRQIFNGPLGLKWAGVLLTVLVVTGSYLLTAGVIFLAGKIHPLAGWLVSLWLMSTTLATRSLAKAARAVEKPLAKGDISAAREKLAMIVGRDTVGLTEDEIVRGTVETVAENTSDGIVAPLFYLFIGGAPLAMAYKAINTLDSMVGYRNERYLDFGWAGARLDDLANYLPARLTAILLSLAAFIGPGSMVRGLRIMARDSRRHPSPNSGYPEAAVAGALGVRLGGYNSYHGKLSFREYIGDVLYPLQTAHIGQVISMMYMTAAMAAAAGWLISREAAALLNM